MGKQKNETGRTYPVRLSLNAQQNIDEITGYIAFINKQPLNAIKVGDAIFLAIDRIAVDPFVFKECQQLLTKTKMYRQASCYSWNIIYKITAIEIVILGIIHQARKPSRSRSLRKVK